MTSILKTLTEQQRIGEYYTKKEKVKKYIEKIADKIYNGNITEEELSLAKEWIHNNFYASTFAVCEIMNNGKYSIRATKMFIRDFGFENIITNFLGDEFKFS